jgi:hypothetical protein
VVHKKCHANPAVTIDDTLHRHPTASADCNSDGLFYIRYAFHDALDIIQELPNKITWINSSWVITRDQAFLDKSIASNYSIDIAIVNFWPTNERVIGYPEFVLNDMDCLATKFFIRLPGWAISAPDKR